MKRLLEEIEYNPGTGFIEKNGAEELVLLYIDLAVRIKKDGLESVEDWLGEKERPVPIREALEGVYLGITPSDINEKYRTEIQDAGLFGTELLEILVAAEGAALIAAKEPPFYVFEYLASLFGEEYYETLKNNLKVLFNKWRA